MLLDASMGEALGEAYAAKFFPPENKAKMDELVGQPQFGAQGPHREARMDG